MSTRQQKLILILLLSFASAAFASFSALVVITPENEARHSFSVQVNGVAGLGERSRVRVIGDVGGGQRVWLIICKTPVDSSRQQFRDVLWSHAENHDIERYIQLFPEQTTESESGERSNPYVEVELSNEQMRRAYIYIDYPRPVDDGGYYYSIDLAYYLEGSLGKERSIEWESR